MLGIRSPFRAAVLLGIGLAGLAIRPGAAGAHCDTLDGPVVQAARAALAKGDVTDVLKWVRQEDEPAVREAFKKTLVVRTKGPEARELADGYFFETLVRLHRAGEGAPYTGLKAAGTELGPAVSGADEALETGNVDKLVKLVSEAAAAGIRRRFAEAAEARKHADENVPAGRKYVAAYVEFVHYAERLFDDATHPAGHADKPAQTEHHSAPGPAHTPEAPAGAHHH